MNLFTRINGIISSQRSISVIKKDIIQYSKKAKEEIAKRHDVSYLPIEYNAQLKLIELNGEKLQFMGLSSSKILRDKKARYEELSRKYSDLYRSTLIKARNEAPMGGDIIGDPRMFFNPEKADTIGVLPEPNIPDNYMGNIARTYFDYSNIARRKFDEIVIGGRSKKR